MIPINVRYLHSMHNAQREKRTSFSGIYLRVRIMSVSEYMCEADADNDGPPNYSVSIGRLVQYIMSQDI